MVLKECYYVEENDGDVPISHFEFGWYLSNIITDTPADKCIMSVALGKSILITELNKLEADKDITHKEYNAIRKFDNMDGTMDDLKTIEKLAEKVKVKLVRK